MGYLPCMEACLLADRRSMFGAMAFWASDTCYTKNLTEARRGRLRFEIVEKKDFDEMRSADDPECGTTGVLPG
jgi:hypothetical protein